MTTGIGSYDDWIGRNAVDCDGDKLGEITDVYYDDVTNRPEWVVIKTGMLGSKAIAPIAGAQIREHTDDEHDVELQLAYSTSQVKHAPDVDMVDDHLTAMAERELYEHYGFAHQGRDATDTYGKDYGGKLRPDVDYQAARFNRQRNDWDAPGTEQGGEIVTEATAVSEQVQKTAQPETVRLRKYRHTEMVPVTKEEIRVEKVDETTTQTQRPR